MRKNIILFVIMSALTLGNLQAQTSDLFMPKELQDAYEAGTRSYTGVPGENYFQNTASYDIDARFDPETGVLEGEETIQYQNNSPDTLDYIVLRVYMNLFKKGVPRDFNVGAADLHEGVEINNLTINGRKLDSDGGPRLSNEPETNYLIRLLNPVHPDEQATISLEWKVQLPTEVTIRMGKYGAHNWMVAYWYPRVSVYDDIMGWDTHPFRGSAEFYNDFSDYNVKLTLPGEHMVWATGELQNPEKHYRKEVLEKIRKARKTDEVIPVVTREEIENSSVLKDKEEHTWHFIAQEVPDFAFATSDSYLWDATSVDVNTQNERRTLMSAVYEPGAPYFDQVAEIGRKSIKLFSEGIMGATFPWPKLTAFNGSGGMEFPMLINDGAISEYKSTVHLTAHEIGHNYFPFYVMTNESYYAFMDEGLVTCLPRIAEEAIIEDYDSFSGLVDQYEQDAGNFREVPLMVKSYMISDYSAYRLHAYQRPATAFYLLRRYLGEADFHKALEEYVQRWARKKPTPYDFFFTFEDVLDMDLTWFWNPWFFEFGYPDLAVTGIEQTDQGSVVNIEKKGRFPVPVRLEVFFADGATRVYNRPLDVWKDGRNQIQINVEDQRKIDSVNLGSERIPDTNPNNNKFTIN
ncbi:MAG: M1 family metallopeptidase [Bacteroidales bacterium]